MNNINFDDLEKEIKDLQTKMQERGFQCIKEISKEIFDKYPELHSFSWDQYTPYFNDGDECVFRVNDWLKVQFEDGYILEDWSSTSRKYAKNESPKYMDAADEAYKLVSSIPEDVMKKIFGDHIEVTIRRNGIEVEDYEHD